MDTEPQIIETMMSLPIEAQAFWLSVGMTAGIVFCAPVVLLRLIRRAQKAGEGRFDD